MSGSKFCRIGGFIALFGWAQCDLDKIIIGAVGAAALMAVACVFGLANSDGRVRTWGESARVCKCRARIGFGWPGGRSPHFGTSFPT